MSVLVKMFVDIILQMSSQVNIA